MAKQKQKLIVGQWTKHDTTLDAFVPCQTQPDEPITEMAAMLSWVKENYGTEPGEYAFVRQVPGAWVNAKQIEFSWDYKEDA